MPVGRDLVGDPLLLRFGLVQSHARDFGIGKRAPRDHGVIGTELLEAAEQCVDRGVPRLVRRGVGELERARHVAAGVDVGIDRLQIFVGLDRALFRRADAELLQPIAGGVGHPPDCAQQHVEGDAHFPALVLGDQHLLAILDHEPRCSVAREHLYPLFGKAPRNHARHFRVLADQHARQHLHLRHLRAEAREALRQLATDRPAAQHQQSLRQLAHVPQGIRGDVADLLDAGNRRHERPGAGGDDDGARRQGLAAGVDLHRPGRGDLRLALDAFDAERGVALRRIVRLDGSDYALHALHHVGEIEVRAGRPNAQLLRAADVGQQPGRPDQRLGRHAAGVEAIAAHAVLLDQRDLGFDRCGDIGGYQPAEPAPITTRLRS